MDTYITNKIVNNESRATGGNVGYASTIDLFKLYGETTLKGVAGLCTLGDGTVRDDMTEQECSDVSGTWNENLTELSRGLLYFDLAQLKAEIENQVDVQNEASLKVILSLKDVQGTQVAPSFFDLELCPLEASFEEGLGDNITTFGDSFAANWVSRTGTADWSEPGGELGVDYSAPIVTQTFTSGTEDLEMDITSWVQSVWRGDRANYGWMLKFTDALEGDSKTYFVKRFSSRHSRNPMLRPMITASWNNFLIDDHLDFYTGSSNKLTIKNFVQGSAANTTNPPKVTLSYGTWSKESTASLVSLGSIEQTGHYEASINVDLYGDDSALATDITSSGSLLVQERWTYEDDGSPANTILIHSGSITMKYPLASASGVSKEWRFSLVDLKSSYVANESPQIRLFVRDRNLENEPVRIPIQLASQIVRKAYYQVKDTNNMKVIIPFSDKLSTPNESTRISTDASGMYFSFPASLLPRGRTYTIDVAYYDRGERMVWESNMAFKVK